MKLTKTYLEEEQKMNWPSENALFLIVNTDRKNIYGEDAGYHIMPARGVNHLTIQNSSSLLKSQGFATHHVNIVKHHDEEPYAANARNNADTGHRELDS